MKFVGAEEVFDREEKLPGKSSDTPNTSPVTFRVLGKSLDSTLVCLQVGQIISNW